MSARPSTLRALALVALLLPGLILSGAHLCVCLADVLGLDTVCVPMAELDCCGAPGEGPSAIDAPDCGVCCFTIEVTEPLEAALAPESAASGLPPLAAPYAAPAVVLQEPPRAFEIARAAPPLVRHPGRAPTPLRI